MRLPLASFICVLLARSVFAQDVVTLRSVTGAEAGPVVSRVFSSTEMPASFTMFGNFMPSDPLGMLQRKQIQEELDLSEDQVAVVKELQQDIQRQTHEIFASGAKFGGDAAAMMATAQKAIRGNIEKELKEVLSHEQLTRLGQLEVQMSLRNRGLMALTDQKLAKALAIDDEQKKEIREGQRDAQEELRKEIEALRERHRARLLKELLSDKQLTKLEELSGNEYQVKQVNRRRFLAE